MCKVRGIVEPRIHPPSQNATVDKGVRGKPGIGVTGCLSIEEKSCLKHALTLWRTGEGTLRKASDIQLGFFGGMGEEIMKSGHCEEQREKGERLGNFESRDRFSLFQFTTKSTLIVSLTLLSVLLNSRISGASSAKEILEKVDDLWRGESSYAEMTMDVQTEHYERSMKLKAWSLGKDYSLFVITYPPKDRGVATLKTGQDIWNYLPRVNRVIRVPTSMMMANWMGSHFTNDDLVKESRLSEDYESEITFEGNRDGREVYEISLIPKPDAPVVWGRIEFTILKEELMPLKGLYFDEDGSLVRTMTFSDVRVMAGRRIPAVMELIPEDKPGEKTVITYNSLEIGLDLTTDFFSRQTLTRKDLAQ